MLPYGDFAVSSSSIGQKHLDKLGRHFFSFLILGIASYAGLIFFSQRGELWSAFTGFPMSYFPLLIALTLLNYLLRYFRWQMYLKILGVHLKPWKSFQIFMAGQAMTLTPAKTGEALKGHLLKSETENAWSVGLPAVFAERLTDLMGVVILVALGLSVLPVGGKTAIVGMALCTLFFLTFSRPAFLKLAIRLLVKAPRLSGKAEQLLKLYINIRVLLSLRPLTASLFLSAAAWFVEGLVLHFSLVAYQEDPGIIQSAFVYSLSSLTGALSMLPGGLVVTEGSLIGLLSFFGVPFSLASTVTILVRLCTLWFPILLGMLFLLFLQRKRPAMTR